MAAAAEDAHDAAYLEASPDTLRRALHFVRTGQFQLLPPSSDGMGTTSPLEQHGDSHGTVKLRVAFLRGLNRR